MSVPDSRKYMNDFTHLKAFKTPDGRISKPGLRITCSTCTNTLVLDMPHGSQSVEQAFADRMFRNKGWEIGRNRKYDRCPQCLQIDKDATEMRRAARVAKPASNAVAIKPPATQTIPKPVADLIQDWSTAMDNKAAPVKADEPPSMGREDSRIIFAKLNEVYLDERAGYAGDWSDEKIAKILDVPRSWVATVRDLHFGPDRNEAAKHALVSDVKHALDAANAQIGKITQAVDTIEKVRGEAELERKRLIAVAADINARLLEMQK